MKPLTPILAVIALGLCVVWSILRVSARGQPTPPTKRKERHDCLTVRNNLASELRRGSKLPTTPQNARHSLHQTRREILRKLLASNPQFLK